jgi:hypothetical protein
MSLFNPADVPDQSSSDEIGEAVIDATEAISSSPAALPRTTSRLSSPPPGDSDSFSDAPERPNKWRGSRADLRKHYSDVRAIHGSVNAIEDDDLSTHLYNIHGLKRGIYPDILGVVPKKPVKQWMRKERLLESSGEWYPHRDWTSWPLEPGLVPRGDERATWVKERQGDVEGARRERERQLGSRPGHDLEELLLGEFTKQARITFEAREWDVESHSEDEGRESALPDMSSKKRSRTAEGQPTDSDTRRGGKTRKLSKKLSRNEMTGAMVSRSGTPLKHEMLDGPFKPVVLADDDEAKEIATPMVNHIVQSLDSLLHGLHKSRVHQVRSVQKRQRMSEEEVDEEYSDVDENEDDRQMTESEAESTATETDASPGASRITKKHRRPLRPRDWSEVLSVAAIAGWSPAILKRAQTRCEALFAESMAFHDLDKGPYDTMLSVDTATSDKEQMYGGVHVDGFMQPIKRKAEKQAYQLKITRGVAASSEEDEEEQGEEQHAEDIALNTSARTGLDAPRPISPTAAQTETETEHSDPDALPKCADCGTTDTGVWRVSDDGSKTLCNRCGIYLRRYGKHKVGAIPAVRRPRRRRRPVSDIAVDRSAE